MLYPKPGEATEQGENHIFISGFEPDALQLAHSCFEQRVDLHHCHSILIAIRCFCVLQQFLTSERYLAYMHMRMNAKAGSNMATHMPTLIHVVMRCVC